VISSRSLPLRVRIVVLLALCLMASVPASAGVRRVDPGEAVTLAEDEGLLVVGVDTNTSIRYLRVKRDGALFDGGTLRGTQSGVTHQLYVVPRGRYRWDELHSGWMRFDVDDDEEFGFEVEAGRINYPGHLVYRPTTWYSAMLHVSNRGLLAMDWLAEQHAALDAAHTFAYTGHYPDPFPDIYRRVRRNGARSAGTRAKVESGTPPVSIETLWRESRIAHIELNPAGDLLALATREWDGKAWNYGIDMIDLVARTRIRMLPSPKPVRRLDWSGDRALVVSIDANDQVDALFVVHVIDGVDGAPRRYQGGPIPRGGLLVDAPHADPGRILFMFSQVKHGKRKNRVYHVDIRDPESLDRSRFRLRDAVDSGVRDAVAWFADGQGRLRAAVSMRESEPVLVHGRDGVFNDVKNLQDEEAFMPMAMSADGERLYGRSEKDREQRDLVEFDPVGGKIVRTVFTRPGYDAIAPLFDPERQLIGATYFEDGQVVSHYFDADSDRHYRSLRAAFPDLQVSIVDRSVDATQFVVMVGAGDRQSQIFHYDARAKRASLIESTRPWLDDQRFAPSTVVQARSKDGFEIEAYLTLPERKGQEKLPLILFPHGGPVGVRDTRHFDPEVQFLAAHGYAVLQVNFRGSDGFGRAFREAANRGEGTLIEDDIDTALAAALERHPLDEKRMCALGSSYGGYSALISAIRWPERFRCVVSIAGITDQALFFTASDSGRSKEVRERLERMIGDPNQDMSAMQRNSPLYRTDELDLPVMLVHGAEDLRVDMEHARRLERMLTLAGRPPTVIELKDAGHGFSTTEEREQVWKGISAFLRTHLAGTASAPPLPAGSR
jgi:dipeptidyl aminopeptidase/acylaminoacyl peptidase